MASEVNPQGELINLRSIENQINELGATIVTKSFEITNRQLRQGIKPTMEELLDNQVLAKQFTILKNVYSQMKRMNKEEFTVDNFDDILRGIMQEKSSLGDIIQKLN